MAYLKQDEVKGNGKQSKKTKTAKEKDWRDKYHTREEFDAALAGPNGGVGYGDGVRESRCIAEAIDHLAGIFSTYVTNEINGDNGQPLYTNPNGHPVKIAGDDDCDPLTIVLEGDALDSIADSLKRIADALSAARV